MAKKEYGAIQHTQGQYGSISICHTVDPKLTHQLKGTQHTPLHLQPDNQLQSHHLRLPHQQLCNQHSHPLCFPLTGQIFTTHFHHISFHKDKLIDAF